MKKSLIIILLVIYIFAVVIVGFLGLKMKVSEPIIYVDEIECISAGFIKNTNKKEGEEDGSIRVNYVENLKVNIICRVKPDNAIATPLEFISEESTKYDLVKNDDGTATITFNEFCPAVTVTVKAGDSKGAQLKIKLLVIDDIF